MAAAVPFFYGLPPRTSVIINGGRITNGGKADERNYFSRRR